MTAKLVGAEALQRRLRAISGPDASRQRMRLLGIEVQGRAKRTVARKTGNLGRTIQMTDLTPTSVTIEAGANYAGAVELGTRPHIIRPVRARALRFAATSGGARLTGSPRKGADVVFARRVHHPGTKAQPFLRPAAASALSDAGDIVLGHVVIGWNQGA